jgi:hypothetical protein
MIEISVKYTDAAKELELCLVIGEILGTNGAKSKEREGQMAY